MESSYLVWTVAAVIAVVALLFVLPRIFGRGRRWSGQSNLDMSLDAGVRHLLDGFLTEFANRLRWNSESTRRLRAAGDEVLLTLASKDDDDDAGMRRLRVSVRHDGGSAVMEFLAAPQGTNFEEQLRLLERHAVSAQDELSLRLLEHYASSVRHRHYLLNDLITVRVEGSR